MLRSVKMILVIVAFILLSIIFFLLLARFYPPLDRYLFGGEFEISFDDIQFWVEKVPNRNYYKVYARYLRHLQTELPDFGHMLYFDIENGGGGLDIMFNPEDNKVYGGGRGGDPKQKWELYRLGEGKIEKDVFKPIFPDGTKFTFLKGGSIVITDAPAYYITIHLPSTLRKLEKEELTKPSIVEIVGDEDYTRRGK